MARAVLFFVFVLAVLVLLDNAVTNTEGATIDQTIFPNRYPVLLAFDLHDEDHPLAGLIVNASSTLPMQDINVGLPFKISKENSNERGLFRLGRYNTWTLITFSNINNVWPQAISFDPEINRSAEDFNAAQQGSGTIYFRADGQFRRFRYRYPNAVSSKSFASIPTGLQIRRPDAIAVLIPEHSREYAVGAGQLSIPARLVESEPVFPAETPDPNQHFLEIAYEVPATSFQKMVVKWGVKALAALVPIGGLFILSPEQIRSPRLRRGLMWAGGILFLVMLTVIIWVSANTNDGGDVIGDLILLFGSALVSAGMYLSKSQGGEIKAGA